jgi:hypothetical protein
MLCSCCLCKRSSRQTTLVCVNAPRRDQRLPLPLHLAAEITDTCFPSLYISLLLAQMGNINHLFLCALWLCSPHEQQFICSRNPRYLCLVKARDQSALFSKACLSFHVTITWSLNEGTLCPTGSSKILEILYFSGIITIG